MGIDDSAAVQGEPGVVAFVADPGAALAAGAAVEAAGVATRLAVHVPCPGVDAASVVRAVGDRDRLVDLLGPAADIGLADTASRYLRRHRRTWPLGDPSPGVGTVFWCRRRPELTVAEYHHAWTTSHGPLALQHHMGMWDYDQVSLLEVHHGDVIAGVDGVAVVQWPSENDLADRFFDGPVGAEAIRADASSFTDLAHTDRFLMREHVLVDPDPAAATASRWITDHRSVHFDRSVADVWAVVGDFPAILDWWPSGLDQCRTEGSGEGMTRTLRRVDGGEVVEVLRHHRPDEAMLDLRIVDGLPAGLLDYTCRYEVRPDGEGCRLDWQPTALVDVGADATFGAMVDGGWRQVSAGLLSAMG
jgi:hypothetical protein